MKYYGYNFQWMFSTEGKKVSSHEIKIDHKALDFVQTMGCNFVRFPLDYRFWIHDFDYKNSDENILQKVDECLEEVVKRGMHCSLCLHRAPGYCINGAELEKDNLWVSGKNPEESGARDAFIRQWKTFAQRYSNYTADQLSFDLVNEPPNIGQYGLTRDIHEKLVRETVSTIWKETPFRPVTIDGLGGGNIAMPELADLGKIIGAEKFGAKEGAVVIQSTRGYQPMAVTHYQASWCAETKGLGKPKYPGTEYDGKIWDIDTIREHFKPWKALSDAGIPVHVGEFGCFNTVSNELALRWFKDTLKVFHENGWGFSLWEFDGVFGIVNHGRKNTKTKFINGFNVDIQLYELLVEYMK